MDNVPLLNVHQIEAIAPNFIFGDNIEDTPEGRSFGHSVVQDGEGLQPFIPPRFLSERLGPIHSLQHLEQQFRSVFDNKNACLGYTRDHGLTPLSSGGTHRHRILEPWSCENVDFD